MRFRISILLISIGLSCSLISCSSNIQAIATNSSLVRYFDVIPSPQGYPPSVIVTPDIRMPFPNVTRVLTPGEKMYLVLVPDEKFSGDFSRVRFTFFNKDSSKENLVDFPSEAGPSGPSEVTPEWCLAPNEPGNYEIRVYFEDEVVAAQSLEVKYT